METTKFLSEDRYLYLPTKGNPRVILNVSNKAMAQNAFKLYNPFSTKAKLLKKVSEFCYVECNGLFKIGHVKTTETGSFVKFLESELKQSIAASLYHATAGDKVVLQLQSEGVILGYLKYPLTPLGVQRIQNEIKGVNYLSNLGWISPLLAVYEYKNKPVILLEELQGDIGEWTISEIHQVLDNFKTEQRLPLQQHPRTQELLKACKHSKETQLLERLQFEITRSEVPYCIVFEHGDFTPWNLINNEGKLVPFDFEYCHTEGLEHLDAIKYYYQIGSLLQGLKGSDLMDFVREQLPLIEFERLFHIYLIKDILRKESEGENYQKDLEMLQL